MKKTPLLFLFPLLFFVSSMLSPILSMEPSKIDSLDASESDPEKTAEQSAAYSSALQQWKLAHAAGDLEAQVTSLRQLMAIRPDRSGEWLRLLSETYQYNGFIKESFETAREWIALEPTNSQAHLHLANSYYLFRQMENGHQVIKKALELTLDTIPLRRRLAEAYLSEQRRTKALQTYWELFPELPTVSDRLRLIEVMDYNHRRDDFAGTLDERITWLFPDRQETAAGLLFRGDYAITKGYFQTARQELAKARELEPANSRILDSLIHLALKEKNFAEAVRLGREALTMENTGQNKIRLAYLLLHNNEKEEAFSIIERHVEHFAKVLEDWPAFFAVLDPEERQKNLVEIIENHLPTMDEPFAAKLGLAEYYFSRRDFSRSEKLLWEVYRQEPEEGVESYYLPRYSLQNLRESAEYRELRIPRQNLRTFSLRMVINHPTLQRANENVDSKQTFASDIPENLNEMNALRSHALGYLLAIAMVNNQEDQLADKLNEHLATLPAHRILIEKLKAGQFDDLFINTLQAVARGDELLPPHWEAPIYLKLHKYSREGLWKKLPDSTRESLLAAKENWLTQRATYAPTIQAVQEAQEWQTLLKNRAGLPEKEEAFKELDAHLEKLSNKFVFKIPLHQLGIRIAVLYGDFDHARERLHSFEPHPLILNWEILWQAVRFLSEKERPLKESEKAFLRDFLTLQNSLRESLPEEMNLESPWHGPIGPQQLNLPFHLSQPFNSELLSQFEQLYTNQKELGITDWKFLFPATTDAGEPGRTQTIEEQTLRFFMALWDKDYSTAKTKGAFILESHEDFGARLNLVLLQEEKGNIREALALLEEAQITHGPLLWVTQWKMIHLASTDKEFYSKGQNAVRRLVRDGDQRHGKNLPDSLKEWHDLLGMEEEWQEYKKQQQEMRQTAVTPVWYRLYRQWDSTGDPKNQQQLAKDILRNSPMVFREATVRQNAGKTYPRNQMMIRLLLEAKTESIDLLQSTGELSHYIASLEQELANELDSPEILGRLIEALEFSATEKDLESYYRKAIALSPSNALLRESFAGFLYEREKYEEMIEFFQNEVAENPYLVLRGDHPKLETAWHRNDKIPALVENFLQRPALELNLYRISRNYGNLGRILQDVSVNLEEKGYPMEAAQIRSVAIEKLPVESTLEVRLKLLRKLTQAGETDSARALLLGFFEDPGQNPAQPFLFNGDPTFNQPVQANWLDHLGPWNAAHPRRLPYPLQLMRAAPPDLVAEYREMWLERQDNFPQVDDPAEALLGAILHWAIRHPDFPESLIAVAEIFGPGGPLPQQQQQWFERTFQFPFLESLPYFDADERIRGTLYQGFGIDPGKVRAMMEKGPLRMEHREMALNQYRSALLIKGMDRAWDHHEEVFHQMLENRGPSRAEELYHFPDLLREANHRLETEDFEQLTQTLLDSSNVTRLSERFVEWEKERQRIRQGEVRNLYLAAFQIPTSTPDPKEPQWFYAISSIPWEQEWQREQIGTRHQRGLFYGEAFTPLDGKFDLVVTYSSTGTDEEISEIKIEGAPASGTIVLPQAAQRGQLALTLKDAKTGETVYSYEGTERLLNIGPNILPPLLAPEAEDKEAETFWEWSGAFPRKDPDNRFFGEKTVYFSGYGSPDSEIARSRLIPLEDSTKIVLQGLVMDRFSPDDLFGFIFYNDQGEEIFSPTIRFRKSPPGWSYDQRELYRSSGETTEEGQFPKEAAHARILIRSRPPLNIAHLSLHFLSE